ncbi:MAG: transglutaminase domain-containing protein [Candidatus Hydrogenedentes bacterium]|nr:transglutaminase domain-containing protein [Candidatus Hydrogenedentota bacterium]
MTLNRIAGFALLCMEAALLGVFFGRWISVALILLAAAAGLSGRWIIKPDRQRDMVLGLVLGIVLLLAWSIFTTNLAVSSVVLQNGLNVVFLQFLLAMQAYLFFRPRDSGLPFIFPLLGALALIMAGDVLTTAGRRQSVFNMVYMAATVAYLILAGVLLFTGRRVGKQRSPRDKRTAILSGAVLAAALVLGLTISVTLKSNQQQLDTWFAELVNAMPTPSAKLGFSERARLTSVRDMKGRGDMSTALRVVSELPPGYLRGHAYDSYANREWTNNLPESPAAKAQPARGETGQSTQDSRFVIASEGAQSMYAQEVWPEITTRGALFTNLSTCFVSGPFASLAVDGAGNVLAPENVPETHYRNENARRLDSGPRPLSDTERSLFTSLPEDLSPDVARLAESLFQGRNSVQQKVDAVIGYFREHYEYKLEIEIPRGMDPVTYFLLDRPPAHCEFFASGAAILLRLGGVPCRYVTGFVAAERNPYGGYWIARNRDAHAWVEAWDESRGWFTVEATVADGVPSGQEVASAYSQLWDHLKFRIKEAMAEYFAGGLRGLLRWMGRMLAPAARPLTIAFAAVLFVGALVSWVKRRSKRMGRAKSVRQGAPYIRELHALLKRADRNLARVKVTRGRGETLHQFAARLESGENASALAPAAAWYRFYAVARFGPPPGVQEIEQLKRTLPR